MKTKREEYEVLKELADGGFKYIDRDRDGDLYTFLEKPEKRKEVWISFDIHRLINKTELDFIKWEDEEPHNIAELIEEYEDSKEYKDSLVIEYFMDKE